MLKQIRIEFRREIQREVGVSRKTPRGVGFCWHCSKQLYGNHYAIDKTPDGREVAVHKICKKENANAKRR
jgi:hypothetical protein